MDQNLGAVLESFRRELGAVSGKLETVADGVGSGFKGIGNEYCAGCLNDVAKRYRVLEKQMQNITLTEPVKE